MFSIFEKKSAPTPEVATATRRKTVNEIVRQIHREFSNASSQLLEDARRIMALHNVPKEDRDRADKLRKAGFTGNKLIEEVEREKRLEHQQAQRIAQLEKYAINYPNNKFITHDQMIKICEKYGLSYGTIDNYVGSIPEENLDEVLNFKAKEEDTYMFLWSSARYQGMKFSPIQTSPYMDIVPKKRYQTFRDKQRAAHQAAYEYARSSAFGAYPDPFGGVNDLNSSEEYPKFICASPQDMKGSEMGLHKGTYLPDPVVLHFVGDGYLIVSKWGLEGEDPDLVNENMN